MQALKGIVIFMGLMIITVMVLIVYGMVQKGSDPDFSFFGDDAPLTLSSTPSTGGFDRTQLGLPATSRILSTTAAEGRLILNIDSDADNQIDLVILLDLETGQVVGRVGIKP